MNPGPNFLVGPNGTGRINGNGQKMLELCFFRGLCVTNNYFQGKPQHHVSWKHPRSHRWHQLHLIISRLPALQSFLSTRSYHSADCNTDYAVVCCRVKIQPRKIHCTKPVGLLRINTTKTADPTQKEEFLAALEQALQDPQGQDAISRWNFTREAVYNVSMLVFGKKERRS